MASLASFVEERGLVGKSKEDDWGERGGDSEKEKPMEKKNERSQRQHRPTRVRILRKPSKVQNTWSEVSVAVSYQSPGCTVHPAALILKSL